MRERLRSTLSRINTKNQKKSRGKQVDTVTTPTAVSIRGALNTNSPFDELVSMDFSSNFEVESGLEVEYGLEVEFGLDIESDITSMTEELFSVDAWEAEVRAVQQRIKELSKMDSLFIKNTQVLKAKGKKDKRPLVHSLTVALR